MNRNLVRFTDPMPPDIVPPGKTFRFLFDAHMNMMRVVCSSQRAFECMREAFSDTNKNAFYVSMYGYKSDSRVYLINMFGYFKPGLFFDIAAYIKANYGSLDQVHISEQCRDYISEYLTPLRKYVRHFDEETFEVQNICDDSGRNARLPEERRIHNRDYQDQAIRKVIFEGFGRGLIELPTSAGKSLVIANLIYTVDKCLIRGLKYLIFVPNTQLVAQFYKDLLDYGFEKKDVTQLVANGKGAAKFSPDARIIISNRQFLFKNKDKIPQVDVVINDEVHQSKPKSATIEIIDGMDCKMKIGLSATIPRAKYERLSLVGSFGRLLFAEDITSLQRKGYISKLEINLVKIRDGVVQADRNLLFHENPLRRFNINDLDGQKFNEAYDAEIAYINDNYSRLYAPIIDRLTHLEGNTLVLFDRLEFGGNMFELAKSFAKGRQVFYIDGQTPVQKREEMRQSMETSDDNIVFGQCSVLSTGINIKNLTNLVMMVSTKSFSRILQSIGRTLRLHKNKDTARLFDISFNFKYSQKHLSERLQIYREMYGKSPDSTTVVEI